MVTAGSRAHTRDAVFADSDLAEGDHGSGADAAVRGEECVGEVGQAAVHGGLHGFGTSEDERDRAPSCHAPMLAGRATTREMEILHAFAEDEPRSRHQQKKLQLCR